ncbi:uncharacterized protein LOC143283306 [Babylonia areolata]|uniref:uncharacterized protein LOC143283306 n=1 Tax=Babylonia areolata TaxID=304850 RepID=UPI003FD20406
MFSRLQRRRSNLQDLGRLSKSCPAVDQDAGDESASSENSGSESWGSSASSLTDPFAETGEELSAPVSRAEKQLARQSLRRSKQREVQKKRGMEQNKISMDDYISKQAQFRSWLLEEQKKQSKDLSSPKRKTYFKMFVRLWNKRHLPEKYYESRVSWHREEEGEGATPPGEEQRSPLVPERGRFSLLQNSPALDPSLFPHTIDLSSDSITTTPVAAAASSPSTFSTFGKATPVATTPSLTPFRFTGGAGGKKADVFQFGENKENAKHHSLPSTFATREHLRTATISPHKKMMSACQERSLDRVMVSWSPRGQPKLNPVNTPRCPSPLTTCSPSVAVTITSTSRPGPGFAPFPHSPGGDVYHQVKDVLPSSSPVYSDIPAANDDSSSQNGSPQLMPVKGRAHRRRSRSVDDAPVYAVPSKQCRDRVWSERPPVCKERASVSPPPVPPKRFDPHVEGLGIPFSVPNSAQKGVVTKADTLPSQLEGKLVGDGGSGEKENAKKSSNPFKGKLPWFGKKLTSRRRSRSCDALSPCVQRGDGVTQGGIPSADEGFFPLVKLERSPPTLGRRVLTRPLKPPGRQPDVSVNKQMECRSSPSAVDKRPVVSHKGRSDTAHDPSSVAEVVGKPPPHSWKFELMEYSSSPMRLGGGIRSVDGNGAGERTKTGTSLRRRRSRSLECMASVGFDRHMASSQAVCSDGGGGQILPPGWTPAASASRDTHTAGTQPQSSFTHPPASSHHLPKQINIFGNKRCDEGSQVPRPVSCEAYDEVKSRVQSELSSLVDKLQEGCGAGASQVHTRVSSLTVGELQSSPVRLGKKQEPEGPSTPDHMDQDDLSQGDASSVNCFSDAPGQAISKGLHGAGQTSPCVAEDDGDVVMMDQTGEGWAAALWTDPVHHTQPKCTQGTSQQERREELTGALSTEKTAEKRQQQENCEEMTSMKSTENVEEITPKEKKNEGTSHVRSEGPDGRRTTSVRAEPVYIPESLPPPPREFADIVCTQHTLQAAATLLKEDMHHFPSSSQADISLPTAPDPEAGMMQTTTSKPQETLSHETRSQREVVRHPFHHEDVAFSVNVCTAQCFSQVRPLTPSMRVRGPQRRRSRSVDGALTRAGAVRTAKPQASAPNFVSAAHENVLPLAQRTVAMEDQPVTEQKADLTCHDEQDSEQALGEKDNLPNIPAITASTATPTSLKMQPATETEDVTETRVTLIVTQNKVPPGVPVKKAGPPVPQKAVTPAVAAIQQQFGGSMRSAARSCHRRRSRSVGDMTALEENKGNASAGEGGGFASVRAFWDNLRGRTGEDRGPGVTLQRKPSTMRRLQQQLFGAKQSNAEMEGTPPVTHPGVQHLTAAPASPGRAQSGQGVTHQPPLQLCNQKGVSAEVNATRPVQSAEETKTVVENARPMTLSLSAEESQPQPQTLGTGIQHARDALDTLKEGLAAEVSKHWNPSETGSPVSSMRDSVSSQTEKALPIYRSPHVTVRRQSSRNRSMLGEPGTPGKGVDSPLQEHCQVKQAAEPHLHTPPPCHQGELHTNISCADSQLGPSCQQEHGSGCGR